MPETPNVLGLLRVQVTVTIDGVGSFRKWAAGEIAAAAGVREAEERADVAKRELLRALRAAFVTPIEPEDLFALSQAIDRILNRAGDVIGEAAAMAVDPDPVIAEMAGLIHESLMAIDRATSELHGDADRATEAADAAVAAERRLERVYYNGMAALLSVEDRSERISRRELYRQCRQIGETVVEVADRIVYAVVKES
jgi:uncharacterized protein Yka (UPF0111/DUF47 family)